MNADDLEHLQVGNQLTLTDRRTGRQVFILVTDGIPGCSHYSVMGDDDTLLQQTDFSFLAQQATFAYLEKCRREQGIYR